MEAAQTGQKKLEELIENLDMSCWDGRELEFLTILQENETPYECLTKGKKSWVLQLYEKLMGVS